jgi:hypothetical protein
MRIELVAVSAWRPSARDPARAAYTVTREPSNRVKENPPNRSR